MYIKLLSQLIKELSLIVGGSQSVTAQSLLLKAG